MDAEGGTTLARACVAEGCRTSIRPDKFMCRKHWDLVPSHLRGLIGQALAVHREQPTPRSRSDLDQLGKLAIAAVAKAEGQMPFAV